MESGEVVADHVSGVLDFAGGNKSRASRILGISRPALDRKLAAVQADGSEDPD